VRINAAFALSVPSTRQAYGNCFTIVQFLRKLQIPSYEGKICLIRFLSVGVGGNYQQFQNDGFN
jgi:hypothetical protein